MSTINHLLQFGGRDDAAVHLLNGSQTGARVGSRGEEEGSVQEQEPNARENETQRPQELNVRRYSTTHIAAFMRSAQRGDVGVLQDLLQNRRCDINCTDKSFHEWTALHHACYNGHFEIVNELVRSDVGTLNINAVDCHKSRTPLFLAAEKNFSSIVRLLLDNGANPRLAQAETMHTPIHASILHQSTSPAPTLRTLQTFLEYSFARNDPMLMETRDAKGRTPLLLPLKKDWQHLRYLMQLFGLLR